MGLPFCTSFLRNSIKISDLDKISGTNLFNLCKYDSRDYILFVFYTYIFTYIYDILHIILKQETKIKSSQL